MSSTTSLKPPFALQGTGKKKHLDDYIFPKSGEQGSANRLFLIASGTGHKEKEGEAAQLVGNTIKEYIVGKDKNVQKLGQVYMNDALRYTERQMQKYVKSDPHAVGVNGSFALVYLNNDDTMTIAWTGKLPGISHPRQANFIQNRRPYYQFLSTRGK